MDILLQIQGEKQTWCYKQLTHVRDSDTKKNHETQLTCKSIMCSFYCAFYLLQMTISLNLSFLSLFLSYTHLGIIFTLQYFRLWFIFEPTMTWSCLLIMKSVEILPQSQTSVMNDCSTCREIKCRARSLKCENEFLYISLINSVLYILDTEG